MQTKCCSSSDQKGKYQQKELKYYSENEPLHINSMKKGTGNYYR